MTARTKYSPNRENLEIDLLMHAVMITRGISLHELPELPVRRKIWISVRKERVQTISGLVEKMIHDEATMERFLSSILPSVRPLSAAFFLKFRKDLVPWLRTWPFIRLWQIGSPCISDLYHLAIILLEEDLYERCLIYVTDRQEPRLQNCRLAMVPMSEVDRYAKLYAKSGGRAAFSDYVLPHGASGLFDSRLRKNMIFSQHNIVSDSSFNEFNLVLCREPLSPLHRLAQDKVSHLLEDSLVSFGVLSLPCGDGVLPVMKQRFELLDSDLNLFRKTGGLCLPHS